VELEQPEPVLIHAHLYIPHELRNFLPKVDDLPYISLVGLIIPGRDGCTASTGPGSRGVRCGYAQRGHASPPRSNHPSTACTLEADGEGLDLGS